MIYDKQLPWHMARIRKDFVFWVTMPIAISETFWKTWAEVYNPR